MVQNWTPSLHQICGVVHLIVATFYFLRIECSVLRKSNDDGSRYVAWYEPRWRCASDFLFNGWWICPELRTVPYAWPFSKLASYLIGIAEIVTAFHHFCMEYMDKESLLHTLMDKHGVKLTFWLEYMISAPPITVVVLYFSGVTDLLAHLAVYTGQIAVMGLGLAIDVARVMPKHCKKDENKLFFYLPWVCFAAAMPCFLVVWVPILLRIFSIIGSMLGIFFLVLLQFVLFFVFAAVEFYYTYKVLALLQRNDSAELSEYFKNERMRFTVLSLTSKVSLAFLVFYYL